MMSYQQFIREDLAALGMVGRHDPAVIEAWMRVEHSTLDGLTKEQFRREVRIAVECADATPANENRQLAESFGLKISEEDEGEHRVGAVTSPSPTPSGRTVDWGHWGLRFLRDGKLEATLWFPCGPQGPADGTLGGPERRRYEQYVKDWIEGHGAPLAASFEKESRESAPDTSGAAWHPSATCPCNECRAKVSHAQGACSSCARGECERCMAVRVTGWTCSCSLAGHTNYAPREAMAPSVIPTTVLCSLCDGAGQTGMQPDGRAIECRDCNGKGVVPVERPQDDGTAARDDGPFLPEDDVDDGDYIAERVAQRDDAPPSPLDDDEPGPKRKYPRSWLDVARDRGVKVEEDGSIHAGSFAAVGILILNGCPNCEASVAPYNSYQVAADNPYAYCAQCAGVGR